MRTLAYCRLKATVCCACRLCRNAAMFSRARKLLRRYLDTRSVLLVNFTLALVNLFLLVMQLHVRMPPTEAYFYSPISPEEKSQMIDILRVFTKELDRNNILYFIGSGTLLGSYRHHGPIPWDDDSDLYLFKKDLPRLKQIVAKMGPKYSIFPGDTLAPALKFFAVNSSRHFIHHSFTWPYVDLYFIDGNATHYLKTDLQHEPLPKKAIFPLVRRPYNGLWLLSPCNVTYILREYKIEECYNRRYSHVMELPILSWAQRYVPCKRLFYMFPFVFRKRFRHSEKGYVLKETLMMDSWVLGNASIHYPKTCHGREGTIYGA